MEYQIFPLHQEIIANLVAAYHGAVRSDHLHF